MFWKYPSVNLQFTKKVKLIMNKCNSSWPISAHNCWYFRFMVCDLWWMKWNSRFQTIFKFDFFLNICTDSDVFPHGDFGSRLYCPPVLSGIIRRQTQLIWSDKVSSTRNDVISLWFMCLESDIYHRKGKISQTDGVFYGGGYTVSFIFISLSLKGLVYCWVQKNDLGHKS